MNLNESAIEDAALMWFGGLGYTVLRGLDIAPGELMAERRPQMAGFAQGDPGAGCGFFPLTRQETNRRRRRCS